MPEIDPITAEIIRCGLEDIANEMGLTMTRTATTPIFSEAHDFSTAIFDHQGRMQALAQAIAIHMGAMKFSVQSALEYFGPDRIYHGDVILLNDPYYGGSHLPDWTLFTPVFYRGELVLFPAVRAHLVDTGGAVPGGYNPLATDIWQEGLRLPPIKIFEKGEPREDILRMLAVNNRCPTFLGDLQAMIGSCKVGERRILEILERYGVETVVACLEYVLDYAERRFRAEIASWPDGVYHGEAYLEHDGQGTEDIAIRVTATIQGDSLLLDFTGTDPQTPGFVNSSLANDYSWIFLTLASMIDESIPKNDGLFRPLRCIFPRGTVVNPTEPAPCNACTVHAGGEVGEAVAVALAQAVPERAYNQNLGIGMPIVTYGRHPLTGELWLDQNIEWAGWCDAAYGMDGWGALPPAIGGVTLQTAELNERVFPMRNLCRELTPDTGGAGKWRGGLGILFQKQALAPLKANLYVLGDKYPKRGTCGGRSGGPNRYFVSYGSERQREIPRTGYEVPQEAGEVIYAQFGGGGGWGDPLERDPQLVREDVMDEYVSIEGARRDYGVVIDPETLEVDLEATGCLREEMRKERL